MNTGMKLSFYTKTQERVLLKIPTGVKGNPDKVKALAPIWGKGVPGLVAKWYALHAEKKKIKDTSGSMGPVSVAAPALKVNASKNGVDPMKFDGVDFTGGRSKVMPLEEASMRAGLDLAIKNELANPKRGILFPTRLINRAKKYFKEKYAKNAFSFHSTGKKKDTNSILVKRM